MPNMTIAVKNAAAISSGGVQAIPDLVDAAFVMGVVICMTYAVGDLSYTGRCAGGQPDVSPTPA